MRGKNPKSLSLSLSLSFSLSLSLSLSHLDRKHCEVGVGGSSGDNLSKVLAWGAGGHLKTSLLPG